jgi:hypothetical protein
MEVLHYASSTKQEPIHANLRQSNLLGLISHQCRQLSIHLQNALHQRLVRIHRPIGTVLNINYHDCGLLDYEVHAGEDEQPVQDSLKGNIQTIVLPITHPFNLHRRYLPLHL